MPTVTFDGRSFMLDGRRVWLVSGTIAYFRLPDDSWADRLHAAKLAGLNAVEVPVPWSHCEPRPGHFEFTGGNDLRRFILLAGEAGLRVILRPGPFIGEDLDLGGLPTWLLDDPELTPRLGGGPFLEAVSRYITALAEQVKDLQVTSTGAGGPIVLIQNEHKWTCGDDDKAAAYLGEIQRYFRESGLTVPTINANDLWQGLEGQIDCWSGSENLYAMTRQLGHVRPDQPKLIVGYASGSTLRVGAERPDEPDPMTVQRRIGEALSAGGQINVARFCPGTGFGFSGGQAVSGEHRAHHPFQDHGAMLSPHGEPTTLFGPVRRILHFASRFGRIFAHLEPEHRPVLVDPSADVGSDEPGDGRAGGVSVAHAPGTQGGVTFVFSDSAKKRPDSVSLLLPDGSPLRVPLGEQQVSWVLTGFLLTPRVELDYCALNAFGLSGEMLVCFGPAGSIGELSINGTPLEVEVPKNKAPVVERHEGMTVVVVNEEAVDNTFMNETACYVGVEGVTAKGEPVPIPSKQYHEVLADGTTSARNGGKAKAAPKATLGAWERAGAEAYLSGESPRFAAIEGPTPLPSLGTPRGYGWYRAELRMGAAKKMKVGLPGSADRFQLFIDGEPAGVIGEGHGASAEIQVSLKKGARVLAMLADNMGRVSGGANLRETKGLNGHLCELAPFKIGKPSVVPATPIDPLTHHAPLYELRPGDVTLPAQIEWAFKHLRKSALHVALGPVPVRGEIVLNGEPIRFLDEGETYSAVLDESLNRGNNTFAFSPMNETGGAGDPDLADDLAPVLASLLAVTECTNEVTSKAEFAFAKWEPPTGTAYKSVPKTQISQQAGPCWWRTHFAVSGGTPAGLALDLTGMTKGHATLNGRELCRYFVATGEGKPVPPGSVQPIPPEWLVDGSNELVVFDEHGGDPSKIKLTVIKSGVFKASAGG